MNKKEDYYKVTNGDMNWTCSAFQLKNDVIGWAREVYDEGEKLKIEVVRLTRQEFNDLPEFEG